MKTLSAVGAGLILSLSNSIGAIYTYTGNGNSGGGPVASGTLTMSDDGAKVSATFKKGGGSFADNLVIYIDSKAGGFSDTLQFSDNSTPLKRSISGLNADGSMRSQIFFANNFNADYAIAFGVNGPNKGELYKLASGGSGITALRSINLYPYDDPNSASYTFNFQLGDLGLGGAAGNFFKFETAYVTSTGNASLQSFEPLTGTINFGTVTFGRYDTYGVPPVPEMTNAALAVFGGIVLSVGVARHMRRQRPGKLLLQPH
jgi:hypothetical protein